MALGEGRKDNGPLVRPRPKHKTGEDYLAKSASATSAVDWCVPDRPRKPGTSAGSECFDSRMFLVNLASLRVMHVAQKSSLKPRRTRDVGPRYKHIASSAWMCCIFLAPACFAHYMLHQHRRISWLQGIDICKFEMLRVRLHIDQSIWDCIFAASCEQRAHQ